MTQQHAATTAETLGGGTAGTVMAVLAWVPRLVLLHLAWLALTVLGGVLLGAAPATVVLIRILRERGERAAEAAGEGAVRGADGGVADSGWSGLLVAWRAELGPANRVAGPFLLIGAAAALNVLLGIAGLLPTWFVPAGLIVAAVLALLGAVCSAHALALRAVHPQLPSPAARTAALTGMLLLPGATLSWAITIAALVVISGIIMPVGLLMSGGIGVTVTAVLLARAWEQRIVDARQTVAAA